MITRFSAEDERPFQGDASMNMTKQQKIAIRRPCFDADETTWPGYGWRSVDPAVTLRLTVNVGME